MIDPIHCAYIHPNSPVFILDSCEMVLNLNNWRSRYLDGQSPSTVGPDFLALFRTHADVFDGLAVCPDSFEPLVAQYVKPTSTTRHPESRDPVQGRE